MSLTVTKEFSWDMAHMLEGHRGLCLNIHGHTYKMHVTVAANSGMVIAEGPSEGMICDFKDLKNVVNEVVIAPLDHAYMFNRLSTDSVEVQVAQLLLDAGRKAVAVDYRPTAENMAVDFYHRIEDRLLDTDFHVVKVDIWETPTSFATYAK